MVISEALVDALDQIRELAGVPIKVQSGYRCHKHNAAVGGEPGSLHTLGRAADIVAKELKPLQLFRLAESVPDVANSGLGLYPDRGFLHVDVGRPRRARWGHLKNVGYVSIEEAIDKCSEQSQPKKGPNNTNRKD